MGTLPADARAKALYEENRQIVAAIKKRWDDLIDHGEILTFLPGQFVFYENHKALGAYLLCKGKIALTRSNDPSVKAELSADAQPILGMDYLLSGDPYQYSAVACSEAELCYLPKSEILRLLPQ